MILFWVLMINDILLGSDDSDNELDEIEPDLLYDSDDDTEYVADLTELKNLESSDSEEYVPRKFKQKKPLGRLAMKRRKYMHGWLCSSSNRMLSNASTPRRSTKKSRPSSHKCALSTPLARLQVQDRGQQR